MKRPLFVLAIVITAVVYLYLELFLSDHLMDYSDSLDGNTIEVIGIVTEKQFKVNSYGGITPVVYITPINASIGKNKYILLYMASENYREPFVGETIKVKGKVNAFSKARNPGEFDQSLYYATLKTAYGIKNAEITARNGKVNYLHEGLYRIRAVLESILDNCLEYRDASIMKAILLGDKAFMDEESKQLYKNNGIIHILAVSGLHISLLGMGIFEILRKMKLRIAPACVIAIVFMYLYGQMCGMSSSSFRAVIMFSMRMMAPLVKRTYDMLSALAVAGLMLLIDQPLLLYNSGFLFSFGAILGIALVKPSLKPMIKLKNDEHMKFSDDPKQKWWEKILCNTLESIKVSFSVFMVTLPVYMNFYYTYPIYSMFLNLLVLPLMAPLMVLGIICLLLGGFLPIAGIGAGFLVHIILNTFELLCNITWAVPGKTWYMGHALKWETWLYMGALVFFVFAKDIVIDQGNSFKTSEKVFIKTDIARYALMALALLLLLINPCPRLRITMIDVDQGDGILIQSKERSILIDGGSTGKKNVGKFSIIPYLKYQGIGTIDAAIITHEDQDHISGVLEIMDDMEMGGIRIKKLVLPDVAEAVRGDNYKKLEQRAKDLKIGIKYISCGQKISFNGIELTCLNPEQGMTTSGANAYSTVLYMKYEAFTALFTGDVEEEGQRHILSDIKAYPEVFQNLTMLKVAHHGSMYTTDEEFLNLLRPKLSVISCGHNNSYGHPHRELIERLESIDSQIYRTDECGAIEITVDRNKLRVKGYLE